VDARELLVSNLALIDRAIDFTCRRNRLSPDESEEFKSIVRLKLVDNDYAILRKYEGRSSLATFLAVVVQRMLLDYRIQMWGKWHSSAEAKRLGEAAIEVEKLLVRDGRSPDEAWAALQPTPHNLTRAEIARIASRLPRREPKKTLVGLDEAASLTAPATDPMDEDRKRISEKISIVVRRFIDALADDERLVLQLRFETGMTVAEIARSLHLDQKQLYRQVERQLREIRVELEASGIRSEDAASVIGDQGVILDFRMERSNARPSTPNVETTTDTHEGVR
jgi:RNA polymerase sigma factor for flagellar operon FliA